MPDGMDVDHRPTCDRRCVETDHLRLLTAHDNRRRQGRDWPLGECSRGHSDSHRFKSRRGLICRLCKNEQSRESKQRRKAVRV
ncbi:MAG: HNH endonuclease [Mycolicibacterium frederiksbergense]|nr:HNH endonuclease [Mycolicibacterium frederiksbergense]